MLKIILISFVILFVGGLYYLAIKFVRDLNESMDPCNGCDLYDECKKIKRDTDKELCEWY